MLKSYKNFPPILQKQILMRLTGSVLGLFCVLVILISHSQWQLIFPGLVISLSFFISASNLFFRCEEKRYIVIHGICRGFERTSIRKQIKAIYLESDGKSVKVLCTYKGRPIKEGDQATIYVADTASVYDVDGEYIICNILAIGREQNSSTLQKAA